MTFDPPKEAIYLIYFGTLGKWQYIYSKHNTTQLSHDLAVLYCCLPYTKYLVCQVPARVSDAFIKN